MLISGHNQTHSWLIHCRDEHGSSKAYSGLAKICMVHDKVYLEVIVFLECEVAEGTLELDEMAI